MLTEIRRNVLENDANAMMTAMTMNNICNVLRCPCHSTSLFLFTFNVIVFSGSDSVTGSNDGIKSVRKSHVNATSNLFNKLKMYLMPNEHK